MSQTDFSRRKFLQNVATGSTGAALASLPGTLAANEAAASPAAPYPLVVESYPIAAPGKGMRVEHLKLVTAQEIPQSARSEEHTSELQSPCNLVCRLLLEKKKKTTLPVRRKHINSNTSRSSRRLMQ